ncbi:hypothetical protein [Haladaptatus sp. NG-WS-4]
MSPTSNDESGSLQPLLWFILLTYAVTWVCLVPGIVSGGELTPLTVGGYLSGGFGPTIAALAVTYRNSGQKGVRALVARATVWRVC